jgi:tyrosyl-tRNA synthetase
MSGWNPLVIGPFLPMEVLCGFSKMIIVVCIIGDQTGQLGDSGEYWMGRKGSGLI